MKPTSVSGSIPYAHSRGEASVGVHLHATIHQPDTITLELNGLDEGEFDLVVEMGLPDGNVLSRSVRVEVVEEAAGE